MRRLPFKTVSALDLPTSPQRPFESSRRWYSRMLAPEPARLRILERGRTRPVAGHRFRIPPGNGAAKAG